MAYGFNEDKTKREINLDLIGLDVVYPVGSIYMNVNNINPEDIFGGTWVKIEGRFLLSAGGGYSLGATGGSANASIIKHAHTLNNTTITTGYMSGNKTHRHSFSLTAASAGNHKHVIATDYIDTSGSKNYCYRRLQQADKLKSKNTQTAGAHTHSVTGSINDTNIDHTHSFTISGAKTNEIGVDATGANMPPYLVVNVWKRTE